MPLEAFSDMGYLFDIVFCLVAFIIGFAKFRSGRGTPRLDPPPIPRSNSSSHFAPTIRRAATTASFIRRDQSFNSEIGRNMSSLSVASTAVPSGVAHEESGIDLPWRRSQASLLGQQPSRDFSRDLSRPDTSDRRNVQNAILAAAELGELVPLLRKYAMQEKRLTHLHIASALYRSVADQHLRRVNHLPAEIIAYFAEQIRTCPTEFDARAITNALYGLRGQASEEARDCLKALVPHLNRCTEMFKPRFLANALYGFCRKCTPEAGPFRYFENENTKEAQEVLLALVPHIHACTETFRAHDLSMMLYGIRGFDTSPASKAFLDAVRMHISRVEDQFRPQDMSKALYGLQAQTDCLELREVLYAIAPHVKTVIGNFAPEGIANALFGIRGVTGTGVSADILQSFLPHVQQCTEPFSHQNIRNAFYGCSGDAPEARAVRDALSSHIRSRKAFRLDDDEPLPPRCTSTLF